MFHFIVLFWLGTPPVPFFNDVAHDTGLDFSYLNGAHGSYLFPEITGGGIALLDYDRDGDLDVYCVQASWLGPESKRKDANFEIAKDGGRLFRNQLIPSGTLKFEDVTRQSRLITHGYGQGVAVADINSDGWLDIYITQFGQNQLWVNQKDGTFVDNTLSSALADSGWSTSATFFDYNGDRLPDLYVCHYVDYSVASNPTCYAPNSALDYCGPDCCPASADSLYLNKGLGSFENVSALLKGLPSRGAGLGVVAIDYDQNGLLDLFVANDGDANELWESQAGQFENAALLAGVALNASGNAEASMGIAIADFDGDGDEDLFVTHLDGETNTLYCNSGNGYFDDRTAIYGLAAPSIPFTGFGTGWIDIDRDGWLDLIVVNGAVHSQTGISGTNNELKQPNQVFMNKEGKKFTESTHLAGASFNRRDISRCAAFGDLDNDGDMDILISNLNAPTQLLVNTFNAQANWIGFQIMDERGTDAVGAHVVLKVDGSEQHRWVRRDGSYLASHDARVLFGLGQATQVQSVKVTWPDGRVLEIKNPTVGQYNRITTSQ